ncbi:MAG: sulfoxide reductase heme-binding subunit YedZ [Thiotrichaceae bacterium]|nr:sulfoxide reductase heme-binding subunit YedZ [Thiotrichaceae bacterium]
MPVFILAWSFYSKNLGANPLEAMTHQTGDWALRFLLISLLVSPLKRLLGWNQLTRCRRILGLYAFFYASLHFITYLWLDQFFVWEDILHDIVNRPFITVGMLAYLLLIPLAITSAKFMIRLLKKKWIQLHKLAYVLPILGIVHYWWLVKSNIYEPVLYAVILLIIFIARFICTLKKNTIGQTCE